mgnify:CR=1 FL=1
MNKLNKVKLVSNAVKKIKRASIYEIEISALDGRPVSLSQHKGKHILFVNVASECGFTKQYKELQALSDKYKEELVVIGSPCNQFGKQEPGDASQIQTFCERNFGVTFLLTEKIDLNGEKSSSVKWNFQKYLVDEKGNLIDHYFSITKPMSSKITKHL